MHYKIDFPLLITVITIFTISCNSGPESENSGPDYRKIINNSESSTKNPHNHHQKISNENLSQDLHTVVVNEILPATRYLYLNVSEGNERFWIAVRKQEIKIGGVYYYKRAVLKTNFESKENDKIFEKIYLVTKLVSSNHGKERGSKINDININDVADISKTEAKKADLSKSNIAQKGSIKIADLVENISKYEGKTVQISGKSVKINPGIMNRNWIHIKDGSKDDYDLVITSDTFVQEGAMITMKGIVSVNKDFGAGYKYDIILEKGVLVP